MIRRNINVCIDIEEQGEDYKDENIKFFRKISGEKIEQGGFRANTKAL